MSDITDPERMDVFWELEELIIKKDLDEGRRCKSYYVDILDCYYDVLLGYMHSAYPKASKKQIEEAIDIFRKSMKRKPRVKVNESI
jgi:hypothetical protein